jgi:galactose mutarotase-like enzyme
MITHPDARMKLYGLQPISLENDWLRLTILPEVGGKIYDLIYKSTGRNFLWHNPRIIPQTYAIEANFDNYWCGGWDEGFPTCDECDHAGEHYPNLGELRSLRWSVESTEQSDEGLTAQLSALGPISPVQVRKTVKLHKERPVVSVHSKITNLGPHPIDFIWGTHPAVNPGRNALLRIPAQTGIVGLASHPSLGAPGQHYVWPVLETPCGQTDMSLTQPKEAGIFCGHYATGLESGWYAIEDLDTGEGFLLRFSKEKCPYLWMWLVYGGWRGYRHVILEPWTSYPVNLAEAARQQEQRVLKPGETFEVLVSAMVYSRPLTLENALKEAGSLTIK